MKARNLRSGDLVACRGGGALSVLSARTFSRTDGVSRNGAFLKGCEQRDLDTPRTEVRLDQGLVGVRYLVCDADQEIDVRRPCGVVTP